jgi:hypothetical protein
MHADDFLFFLYICFRYNVVLEVKLHVITSVFYTFKGVDTKSVRYLSLTIFSSIDISQVTESK